MKAAPALVKCQEDDDFVATFEKMMSDDMLTRKTENLRVPNMDVAVPMHLRGPTGDKGRCDPLDRSGEKKIGGNTPKYLLTQQQ